MQTNDSGGFVMEIPYNPTAQENIERIRTEVPIDGLYSTLAKEAEDLAIQASTMTQPSKLNDINAYSKLIEEFTDVLNVGVRILGLQPDWLVGNYKLYTWAKELDEKK